MSNKRFEFREYRNVTHAADELPPKEIEDIAECIRSSFGGTITDEDALHHMEGDQVLVARDQSLGGRVAGFTSTILISPYNKFGYDDVGRELAGYYNGAAISADHQAQGLYGQFFRRRYDFVREHGLDTIYTRTQNPAVLKGISRGVEQLIKLGEVRAFRFGQRVCERAYPEGRLMVDMRDEFPFIDTDAGDALLLTWQLEHRDQMRRAH